MRWPVSCSPEPMRAPRKSRGGALVRLLTLVFVGFVLISLLPQCMQQLGQMAGNAATNAAHQATTGAVNGLAGGLSRLGHQLMYRFAKVLGNLRDQWEYADPAERLDLVCEHVPVEGVDKLCPYFTAAVKGASNAETARIACYWSAAANEPNPQQTLHLINTVCPKIASTPSQLESCLARYTDTGTASNCLASSPEQLWAELRTMIEPIACPPGLPKSLCTTQSASQPSSASTGTPNSSPPNSSQPSPWSTRTDVNYLNCLTHYYQYLRPFGETSCGSGITATTAGCARTALMNFTYQGQSPGVGQVAQCDGVAP